MEIPPGHGPCDYSRAPGAALLQIKRNRPKSRLISRLPRLISRFNGQVGGDGDFDQWVRERWPSLVRLSRVIAGDRTTAEDVLQDALMDVYPRWARLTQEGDPMGYVVRVMTSKIANRRRTAWARRVVALSHEDALLDGYEASRDAHVIDRVDIQRALMALKPRQRSIVALHYLMDWPVAEIAAALDMPVGSVTSDLTRARSVLRKELGGGGDEL